HFTPAAGRAPDDAAVLELLPEVLENLDRPAEQADTLARLAALSPQASRRAAWLTRLRALGEARLCDADAARAPYGSALDADPTAPGVAECVTRLSAKREAAPAAASLAPVPETPAPTVSPLEQLEREARTTSDRSRLGLLVREIEAAYAKQGAPDGALPWVQ